MRADYASCVVPRSRTVPLRPDGSSPSVRASELSGLRTLTWYVCRDGTFPGPGAVSGAVDASACRCCRPVYGGAAPSRVLEGASAPVPDPAIPASPRRSAGRGRPGPCIPTSPGAHPCRSRGEPSGATALPRDAARLGATATRAYPNIGRLADRPLSVAGDNSGGISCSHPHEVRVDGQPPDLALAPSR